MGATASIPDTIDTDEITVTTGLSKRQISSLWTRFYELDRDGRGNGQGYKGFLDADDLRRVPKFSENPMASRLVKVIFDDFGSNGQLTFRQFVNFMSTFVQCERGRHNQRRPSAFQAVMSTTKTDLESIKYCPGDSAKIRKMKFIFRMYDVDHDGRLSKEDVQEILKMMVGKISDEEASLIAEKVIGEFTENQPFSTVTLETFEETLKTLDFNDKMSLKLLK
ncbi:unnamed protein product [Adineta steineri]|uniref:EF-hand domain-containing protein n=1 Tax=Adineta steineri TaxID=433720 RepID=A0A815F9F8_9BILA|nr:unnamed protein product [Adineta steineri]CAF1296327.1 unnamed protein product [Adineta steineri]CAF1311152.1 unnamed protein product [Adineta steineri]CAF1320437.1 unnamed protein product [Adineta steineri]CAF1374267.1 unnamed protein product [Adineta steineri]